MLIEFSVKNFRSIRDEAVLSMVSGTGQELLQTNVYQFDDAPAPLLPLLRSSVIYGANAAGKTNLLRAIAALRDIVVGSTQRNPNDAMPVVPFVLDEKSSVQPTEFEVHFVVNKVRYQYGVVANPRQVLEEWLYAFPKGRVQKWFERTVTPTVSGDLFQNKSEVTSTVRYSDKLRGEKELWERVSRPNATLLATAAQLNSEQLTPIFSWFAERLKISVGTGGWNEQFTLKTLVERKQQKRIVDFLQAADFAIEDLGVHEVSKNDIARLTERLPDPLKDMITSSGDGRHLRIKTQHVNAQGQLQDFDLGDESDGTQKMFRFAAPWMDTLEKGNIMVIDELHDNLHPVLVKYLVEMFHNPEINKKGAQLLFSTHETAILNQELFRRDQIWFCERNADQTTSVFPLSDFKVRKNAENLEKSYLSGRFGALPYLEELSSVFGDRDA